MENSLEASVREGLDKFSERVLGRRISDLRLLTGGANMELWSFRAGSQEAVLRRFRHGVVPDLGERNITLSEEVEVVRRAVEAGVRAPVILGELESGDGLGPGYVMSKASGDALPHRLFKDTTYEAALAGLTQEFARELAKIHSVDVSGLSKGIAAKSPAQLLEDNRTVYKNAGYEGPVIAAAFHWLEKNCPEPSETPCLVHGDFRMGNILVTPEGLSSVLDWELCHIGRAEEDLGWLCTPSWRFGRYDNDAGGVGSKEDLIAAYEAQTGRPVDRAIFDWFLIYACLKWGASTVIMAQLWRAGQDKSLERILVGTRISEVELDVLLLLEEQFDVELPLEALPAGSEPSETVGDVAASELMQAVGTYLSTDVVGATEGAAKFHARIAANAQSIATRMISAGPGYAADARARLDALGMTETELCQEITTGSIDWTQPDILAHLRLLSLERLYLHQPKYAAISVAKTKWGGK